MDPQELRETLRWLRREHPLHLPILVRQVDMGHEWYGDIWPSPRRRPRMYRMRLNSTVDDIQARETLLHEWAHALAYPRQAPIGTDGDHDSIYCEEYTILEKAYRLRWPDRLLPRDVSDRLRERNHPEPGQSLCGDDHE